MTKKVKELVLKEMEKLPNFSKVRDMNIENIRQLTETLEFSGVRKYLQNPRNHLKISRQDIGKNWFQFMLFFILEIEENEYEHFYPNNQLLDIPAQDKVIEMLEPYRVYNIQSLTLEEFLQISEKLFG